nr:BAHD acyltransferase [Cynoglossum officinale]
MASSRVQLISRKFIKPSFSTPPPRNYKLGLLDQLLYDAQIPLAFYYPNKTNNSSSPGNTTTILENSFSKILASYYPLAGRLVDSFNIDCSEMGATLIEAQVNCKMSEILGNPNNLSAQDAVYPKGLPWKCNEASLLVAQISHFDCGGKAISLCMSHKVADAHSLCTFARDWASLAKQIKQSGDKNQSSPSIQLNAASIFPPIEEPSFKPPESGFFQNYKDSVTKRFVFDSSKINEMKAIVSGETGITNPTRVEVVTALLHKCVNSAASIGEPNSDNFFFLVVNMRPLMNPPIPPSYFGNLCHNFGVPFPDAQDLSFPRLAQDLTFPRFVSEIRKAKIQFYDKFKGITANEFRPEHLNFYENMKMIKDGGSNSNIYFCSSLCRFPFHEIDFGWGVPEMTSLETFQLKSCIVLKDDRNGGVEAFVPLRKKVMNLFEIEKESHEFV